MAVDVYQSTTISSNRDSYPDYAFILATFLSGSSHFTIIDSYSSARSLRYKGDPIADDDPGRPGTKYWDTSADVGNSNDWFVVQCETTIHGALVLPKWQAKFQWTHSVPFDDVSGLDYSSEGEYRVFLARFAPKGGWSLADTTPDFAPAGSLYKSSYNGNFARYTKTAIDTDNRPLFVATDGQLVAFDRKASTTYDAEYFLGFMGDYTPVSPGSQPVPRCFLPGGNTGLRDSAANGFLAEDNAITGPSVIYGGFQYEDHNGLWQNTGYTNPRFSQILDYYSQPCQHAISQEVDMVPFFLVPSNGLGLVGTLPCVMRGYGPGMALLTAKEWVSAGGGICPFFLWDGATDLNF